MNEAEAIPVENGAAMGPTRTIPRSVGSSFTPTLAWLTDWLLKREITGPLRCAAITLGYQSCELAAEERPASRIDCWTIDVELEGAGLLSRRREIAEAAWKAAGDHMAHMSIPHMFYLYHENDAGERRGMTKWKLDPSVDHAVDGIGTDPPNEKGMLAANLRVLTTVMGLAFESIRGTQRIGEERAALDRAEMREMRDRHDAMIKEREDLLERRLDREIKANEAAFNLGVKKDLSKAAKKALKLFIQKQMPAPEQLKVLMRTIKQDQLPALLSAFEPEGQQALMGLLNSLAAQQEMEQAAERRAAEKALAAAKEEREEEEKATKLAKKGGAK